MAGGTARILQVLALASAGLVPAAIASAQDTARIEAIERQIRALQEELRQMRRDSARKDAEVRAAREQAARARTEARYAQMQSAAAAQAPAAQASAVQASAAQASAAQTSAAAPTAGPPPSPEQSSGPRITFPSGKPTISDGRYTFSVGLQLHYDVGGYFNGHHPNSPEVQRLNEFGQNLRRARIPFEFKVALSPEEDVKVNLTPDFGGGSPDGTPTLYEATINYINRSLGVPITTTVGYFKPWLTLQDSMSSNDFLFLERPSIVEIARNIAAGDARASLGVQANSDRWFAAAYLTGQSFGDQADELSTASQTGGTLRLAGRPYADADIDLHLGFSGSGAFRLTRNDLGQTIRLRDRPELRIDQNRLIDTGSLAAGNAWEYGPEFALRWRNLLLQGEFIQIGIGRSSTAFANRPALDFIGGYVEGSWVITGEKRPYKSDQAAFGRPSPARPFSLAEGQWGALEAVARYSVVDLNDRVSRGTPAAATGGVYGGRQQVISFGLNWYPIDQIRFMLDYDIIDVDRLNAAGSAQIGQRIQAIAVRSQAAF